MSLLDLRGPEFLQFFLVALAGAWLGGILLRRWLLRPPPDRTAEHESLHPCYLAYLAGGPEAAVDAALAILIQEGWATVSSGGRIRLGSERVATPTQSDGIYRGIPAEQDFRNELVKKVYETLAHAGDTFTPEALRIRAAPWARHLERTLVGHGLWVSPSRRRLLVGATWLPLLAVAALGVAKVYVGGSRGRPVGFLVFLLVVAAILLWKTFPRIAASPAGKALLRELRRKNQALKSTLETEPEQVQGIDAGLGYALFGGLVLATAMPDLAGAATAIPGTQPTSWWSGAGCGAGSSCGSSCGGGCGGGCGGCGGCG